MTDGVGWEMVLRYRWDQRTSIELRALSAVELEITVTAKNAHGGATGSRTVTFADMRAALDELQRSARDIEKLP